MRKAILVAMLLATAACNEAPSSNMALVQQPLNAVTVEEPSYKPPEQTADDTRFCTDHDSMVAYMEGRGLDPVGVSGAIESYEGFTERFLVEHGEKEDCIVDLPVEPIEG